MRGDRTIRRIGLSALLAVGIAACGGNSAATTWSNVTRVTISAQRPGVPEPPGGSPHPVVFTTPAQLRNVTTALNANRIRRADHATSSGGCGGGAQIALVILQKARQTTKLSAYQCAGTTTGDIAGDLTGFLSKTGVSVP